MCTHHSTSVLHVRDFYEVGSVYFRVTEKTVGSLIHSMSV